LAGCAVLAYLRDSLSSDNEEVSERNGADERRTMDGYRPHHPLRHVEKEQTGN
jgi:hypothetical protein